MRNSSELLGVTESDPIDFFIYADQDKFYDALGPATRENVGGEAHADIRTLLLDTGDEVIVENAPRDYYWGCGADGSGKNRLGEILMEVRAILRGRGGGARGDG